MFQNQTHKTITKALKNAMADVQIYEKVQKTPFLSYQAPDCEHCDKGEIDVYGKEQQIHYKCIKCDNTQISTAKKPEKLTSKPIKVRSLGKQQRNIPYESIRSTGKKNNLKKMIEDRFGQKSYSNKLYRSTSLPEQILTNIPWLGKQSALQIKYNRDHQEELPLEIKQSIIPNAGQGVFATENISKKSIIITYIGQMIRVSEHWQSSDSVYGIGWLFENNKPEFIVFEPVDKLNAGRFINSVSQKDCNCLINLSIVDEMPCLFITAKRQIRAGEQLFYHYGSDFGDDKGFRPDKSPSIQHGSFSKAVQQKIIEQKNDLSNKQLVDVEPNILRKKPRVQSKQFVYSKILPIYRAFLANQNQRIQHWDSKLKSLFYVNEQKYYLTNPILIRAIIRSSKIILNDYFVDGIQVYRSKFGETHGHSFYKILGEKRRTAILKCMQRVQETFPSNFWKNTQFSKGIDRQTRILLKQIQIIKFMWICQKNYSDRDILAIDTSLKGKQLYWEVIYAMRRIYWDGGLYMIDLRVWQQLFKCRSNANANKVFLNIDLDIIELTYMTCISQYRLNKYKFPLLKIQKKQKKINQAFISQWEKIITNKKYVPAWSDREFSQSQDEQMDLEQPQQQLNSVSGSSTDQKPQITNEKFLKTSPPLIQQKKGKTKLSRYAIAYRKHSKSRYNKWKHQFPRLRQSQLMTKIIKQWEGYNQSEKICWYERKQVEFDYCSDSQSLPSSVEQNKKVQSNQVFSSINPSPLQSYKTQPDLKKIQNQKSKVQVYIPPVIPIKQSQKQFIEQEPQGIYLSQSQESIESLKRDRPIQIGKTVGNYRQKKYIVFQHFVRILEHATDAQMINDDLLYKYYMKSHDGDLQKDLDFINRGQHVVEKARTSDHYVIKMKCLICQKMILATDMQQHLKRQHTKFFWSQWIVSNMFKKTAFVITKAQNIIEDFEPDQFERFEIMICTRDHDTQKKKVLQLIQTYPRQHIQCWRISGKDIKQVQLVERLEKSSEKKRIKNKISESNINFKFDHYVFEQKLIQSYLNEIPLDSEITKGIIKKWLPSIGFFLPEKKKYNSQQFGQVVLFSKQNNTYGIAILGNNNKYIAYDGHRQLWPSNVNMKVSKMVESHSLWETNYRTLFWALRISQIGSKEILSLENITKQK